MPGQPSQLLSLPVEIFKGRKQSFSWGAGVQPQRSDLHKAQSQAEGPGPSPSSASQLLDAAAPLKTHIWAPARAPVAGVRGCVGCELLREGYHFSYFQEGLSPSSSSVSQPSPGRCVPMTMTATSLHVHHLSNLHSDPVRYRFPPPFFRWEN